MKKHILLFAFICYSAIGFSQTSRFGKIPKQQWSIEKCNFDTTATSIVLFDIGEITYPIEDGHNRDLRFELESITLNFERHLRIKVLKKCDQPFRPLKIPIHSINTQSERLRNFKGLISNGKKSKGEVKLKRDALELISGETGANYYILELNNIPKGSIIDIEYSTESDLITHIPDWSFANYYPTLYSSISYSIPSFFDLERQSELLDKLDHDTFGKAAKHYVHGGDSPTAPTREYSYSVKTEIYSLRDIPATEDAGNQSRIKLIVQSVYPSTLIYNDFSFERGD